MKPSMVFVVLLAALLISGCDASQPDVNTSAHVWSFPESVQGVPIHRIPWNENLPYLYSQPWRTVAPKTFTLSPLAAVRKAAQYWTNGWRLANRVYIEPAGLVGGNTGNPPAVYLVEFVGTNLGLNAAGPNMPKAPTLQFGVLSVNGHTGTIEQLSSGEVHGTVSGGRILRLYPEPATARRVAAVPTREFPQMVGLAAISLAGSSSVWQDGSVAEYGEVWDPLYVYTMRQGTTTYIGTQLNYATAFNLVSEYDKQFACPKKIGALHIVGIRGSTVAFKANSGLTGSFDLSTHKWSFN